MSCLIYWTGLSDAALESDFLHEQASASVSEDTFISSMQEEHPEVICLGEEGGNSAASVMFLGEEKGSVNDSESSKEFYAESVSSLPAEEKGASENVSEDVEIGDFFLEDSSINDALLPEVLKYQETEKKMRELCSEIFLEKLDGIWKKVIPKMGWYFEANITDGWDKTFLILRIYLLNFI